MEETADKHPAINQNFSGMKYEKIPNGTNLSTEQVDQPDERKISNDNNAMDENLTALYWG
jgi:hypothetical protein